LNTSSRTSTGNGSGGSGRQFNPSRPSFDNDNRDRDYRNEVEIIDIVAGGTVRDEAGGRSRARGERAKSDPRDKDLRNNDRGTGYHRSSGRDTERSKNYGRDRYY